MSDILSIDISNKSVDDLTALIKAESDNVLNSFVTIGFYLKYINDNDLLFLTNYLDLFDYAEQVFHFSRTTVKNLVGIASKFCYATKASLSCLYSDYNYSQLVELLPVDTSDIEAYITPDMSVRQIKEWKKSKRAAQHRQTKKFELECSFYDNKFFVNSNFGLMDVNFFYGYFIEHPDCDQFVLTINRGDLD